MIGNRNDVLGRMRAALPESHSQVDQTVAEVAAEGLLESLLQFVLEDYTLAVLGRRPAAPEPDLPRWRRWVAFLEDEYGQDPDLDSTVDYWVLSNLPGPEDQDPHRLRADLGPRLAAALDAYRALRERNRPRPDPATDTFSFELAGRFPELQPDIEDNLYRGQLLGIMFLADVARRVTALHARGGTAVRRAQEIIDVLEAALGESDSLDMAIATGFVEGLPSSYEADAGVSKLLGPRLYFFWQGNGPLSDEPWRTFGDPTRQEPQ